MNICGVKNHKKKISIRIVNNHLTTQNRYNRFRKEVENTYKIKSVTGYGGHTEIIGNAFDIDVYKNTTYVHIIIHALPKTKKKIADMVYKHFDVHKKQIREQL
jgi:hypothetical protein